MIKSITQFTFIFFIFMIQAALGQRLNTSINPANWTEAEWELATKSGNHTDGPFTSQQMMVIDVAYPEPAYVGYKVLEAGGSAIDAALANAFSATVLDIGSVFSFAGILNLIYYEASTGKVFNLNGGYNSVLNEKDPLNIPLDEASGRTVLVPGFMAAAEAAHERFGKLPFQDILAPAIYFAEEGFELDYAFEMKIALKKNEISRLPETKSIFTKENGEWYKMGDWFKQPQLAKTLKRVAQDGSRYMYQGKWGQNFVNAVQREGGFMTMDDLASYEPLWVEPVSFKYNNFDVFAPGLPTTGGVNLAEAFNVLSYSSLPKDKPFTQDPERLKEIRRISYLSHLFGTGIAFTAYPDKLWQKYFSGISKDYDERLSSAQAERLYRLINSDEWGKMITEDVPVNGDLNRHTDATIAIDKEGNVAVLLYTTIGLWGDKTMLYVDGVSIPSPVSSVNNHITLSKMKPGSRLPESFSPLVVLKDNKFHMASVSISTGVHEYSLQNLLFALEDNMEPYKINNQPHFTLPLWLSEKEYKDIVDFAETMSKLANEKMGQKLPELDKPAGPHIGIVSQGSFSKEVLEKLEQLGEPLQEVNPFTFSFFHSYWIGVKYDEQTSNYLATTSRFGGIYGE